MLPLFLGSNSANTPLQGEEATRAIFCPIVCRISGAVEACTARKRKCPKTQLRAIVETLIEANHTGCRKGWPKFCGVLRGEALRLDAVRTLNCRERGAGSIRKPNGKTPVSNPSVGSQPGDRRGPRGQKRRHRGGAPGESSRERDVPIRLNKDMSPGERHYISDCPR